MASRERNVSLVLQCMRTQECQIYFEPEGSDHTLKEGDLFDVMISGPGSGKVEIAFLPKGLIVGGWSGSSTRVRNRAGEDLRT